MILRNDSYVAATVLDNGVSLFLKKLWCCICAGSENECLVLSTELITKGKLGTVKRFEC